MHIWFVTTLFSNLFKLSNRTNHSYFQEKYIPTLLLLFNIEHFTFWYRFLNLFFRLSFRFSILKMFFKMAYDYWLLTHVHVHVHIPCMYPLTTQIHHSLNGKRNCECKIGKKKWKTSSPSNFDIYFWNLSGNIVVQMYKWFCRFFVIHFLPQHNITQSFKL